MATFQKAEQANRAPYLVTAAVKATCVLYPFCASSRQFLVLVLLSGLYRNAGILQAIGNELYVNLCTLALDYE